MALAIVGAKPTLPRRLSLCGSGINFSSPTLHGARRAVGEHKSLLPLLLHGLVPFTQFLAPIIKLSLFPFSPTLSYSDSCRQIVSRYTMKMPQKIHLLMKNLGWVKKLY